MLDMATTEISAAESGNDAGVPQSCCSNGSVAYAFLVAPFVFAMIL